MSHLLAVCTCRHPCLQDTADQLWHWCFRLASVWCFCWSEQKGGSDPGKASLINHVVSLSSSLLSFIKSVQVWVNLWLQVCVIWFVCMGMVRNECARILKLFLRQQWGVATYMDWSLYSTLLNVRTQSTYTTCLFHHSHQHFFCSAFYLTFILWQIPWRATWGQCLAQGYLACRPEQSGIEPPTYRVVNNLLCHAPHCLSSVEFELFINGHFLHLVLLLDVTF